MTDSFPAILGLNSSVPKGEWESELPHFLKHDSRDLFKSIKNFSRRALPHICENLKGVA